MDLEDQGQGPASGDDFIVWERANWCKHHRVRDRQSTYGSDLLFFLSHYKATNNTMDFDSPLWS